MHETSGWDADGAAPPTIDDVRAFWDAAPLWTGESRYAVGTRAFFDEHKTTYIHDCFAGRLDPRLFPTQATAGPVLDLGCGIGFWLIEFASRGFHGLVGADLSARSLELARRRCEIFGVEAELRLENAERLSFPSATFRHVNCQGVIHHTPDPGRAVSEIARVLIPGGSALVSVYYRNAVLRNWPLLRPASALAARVGARLRGRGREEIFSERDADEIVRRYDGMGNPIGVAFSKAEFLALLEEHLTVDSLFFHYFPARSLPFSMPKSIHRLLDRVCPFMIFALARRPR